MNASKPASDCATVKKPESTSIRFLCGGVAGAVSRTCTAPIDRVKVLRQIELPEIKGKSIIKCWKYMINEGGIPALWRGNGINVLKNGPESAIRLGSHGIFKSWLFPAPSDGQRHDLTPVQRLFVAGLSGSLSMSITYPMEILKTRTALKRSTDKYGAVELTRTLYEKYGWRAFYRGYRVAMLSYIPYSSMELALYEILKRKYLGIFHNFNVQDVSQKLPHLNWFESCGLVVCASLPPTSLVYPLNLLRTRLQISNESKRHKIHAILANIVRNEGVQGLYRGYFAQISKTLPAVCIGYATFESLLELSGQPTLASR